MRKGKGATVGKRGEKCTENRGKKKGKGNATVDDWMEVKERVKRKDCKIEKESKKENERKVEENWKEIKGMLQ